MSRSLVGRTIVVTRPRAQAGPLGDLLRERGARVLLAPTIRIVPARTRGLGEALERLAAGSFDWVTITSRATVEMLAGRIPPGSIRARVAAVGEGTADALRTWSGRDPDLVPTTFTTASLGRAMPSGTGRVLCLRADVAPAGLEGALRRKGWSVERADAYRTVVPARLPEPARRALAAAAVDAVTFTSASTVRGFVELWGRPQASWAAVCIGPVTARAARAHGLAVGAVARPHTIEGVVAATERLLGLRRARTKER